MLKRKEQFSEKAKNQKYDKQGLRMESRATQTQQEVQGRKKEVSGCIFMISTETFCIHKIQ